MINQTSITSNTFTYLTLPIPAGRKVILVGAWMRLYAQMLSREPTLDALKTL